MKIKLLVSVLTIITTGCSLPPHRKYTWEELERKTPLAFYIVEGDQGGLLKVLNERGEVVTKANYLDEPVYIKIFSTDTEGIVIKRFDFDEVHRE